MQLSKLWTDFESTDIRKLFKRAFLTCHFTQWRHFTSMVVQTKLLRTSPIVMEMGLWSNLARSGNLLWFFPKSIIPGKILWWGVSSAVVCRRLGFLFKPREEGDDQPHQSKEDEKIYQLPFLLFFPVKKVLNLKKLSFKIQSKPQ